MILLRLQLICIFLVVVVRADDEDEKGFTVHKLCRIPRLKAVTLALEGDQGVAVPEVMAGGLVQTDTSRPLYYKCNWNSTEWTSAVCDDGQWHPQIPSQCIVQQCHHEGTDYDVNTTKTIECRDGSRTNSVTMTCLPEYGYWSRVNGCGKSLTQSDCPKRRQDLKMLAKQPLEPFFLSEPAEPTTRIAMCPKGKTLEFCRNKKSKCQSTNKVWYQLGEEMYSGWKIDCEKSTVQVWLKGHLDRYHCIDVDECDVLKQNERNLKKQKRCNDNWPEASGKGSLADETSDAEPDPVQKCEAPNLYLEERGIRKCHESARCKNTEGGYDCVCPPHLVKNEHDGSCYWEKCADIPPVEHGNVSVMQGRYAFFSCDDHFDLQPDRPELQCQHGEWNGEMPMCRLSDEYCGAPSSPEHGSVMGYSYLVNDIVRYRCDIGYVLQGPRTRVCRQGGYWSDYQPACVEDFQVLTAADKLRAAWVDEKNKTSADFTDRRDRERANVNGFGLDVFFLIDTSASMRGDATVAKMTCLCKAISSELLAGDDHSDLTRIIIISFGAEVTVHMDINDTQQGNLRATKANFDEVKYSGGGTIFVGAIQQLRRSLHIEKRTESKKVLILLTDGHINVNEGQDPTDRFKHLNREIDIMMAVAVGPSANIYYMRQLTTFYRTHEIFIMRDFDDMRRLADKMFETKKKSELCGYAGRLERTKLEKENNRHRFLPGNREEVPEGSWPWLAAVYGNTSRFMGSANIICKQWLLTSLSMLQHPGTDRTYDIDTLSISAGIHYLLGDHANASHIQNVRVTEIHQHPERDLALLKLSTELRLSPRVGLVCLPDTEGRIFEQDAALISAMDSYIVGWGAEEWESGRRDKTGKKLQINNCPQTTTVPAPTTEAEGEWVGGAGVATELPGGQQGNVEEEEDEDEEDETEPLHVCSLGEGEEVCELDRGGALLKKHDGLHKDYNNQKPPRFVAVAIAQPRGKCEGRFESILGVEDWIHATTGSCNLDHHEDSPAAENETC